MLPSVDITKADFQTGSTSPSPVGIAAIIAAGSTGTFNEAATFARDALIVDAIGYGPNPEYGSYIIQTAKKPVLSVRSTTSTQGAYGPVTSTPGTGTATVTTDGTQLPYDEFDVVLSIQQGGTIGQAGITYTWSGDGGDSVSGILALGTNNNVVLGNTGVKVNFGAGTLATGATYQFFTTRPMPGNGDLPASFTALETTRQPWEGVLIDCLYGTGTVGLIDTFLSGLEESGQFHWAAINTRHKTQPVPTAETETAYAAAMQALTQNDASIRMCVGTDAADYTSTISGISQPRPTALFLMARAMLIPIGEDPAFVGRGNIPGSSIADGTGNARWHDEDLYGTLDALRLVTLRSFAPGGPQGVYITNANVLSPSGSDYVWLQHIRCANVACSIAWQVLTGQLSIGVTTKPADPTTGAVYITEADAQRLEGLVNAGFKQPLNGQVTAVQFKLSRDDDLSTNSDDELTGTVSIVAKKYAKKFQVQTVFTKSIAVGS